MNLRYLGDALDHWKGSVFEHLQRENVLKNFLVDPMATDDLKWNRDDSGLFARLLRIEERQLVQHARDLTRHRQSYFAEIPPTGDLFLDPDTGIRTGRVDKSEQYLLPSELFEVMKTEEDRLIVVYQHVRAKTRPRLEKVVAVLREQDREFSCCSYESGTAALLFFSRTGARTDAVRDCFGSLLETHSGKRIGYWQSAAGR